MPVDNVPDDAVTGMEGAIDRITPTEIVGLLAAIPVAQQGHDMMRQIAFRAAEQRLLEHLIQNFHRRSRRCSADFET